MFWDITLVNPVIDALMLATMAISGCSARKASLHPKGYITMAMVPFTGLPFRPCAISSRLPAMCPMVNQETRVTNRFADRRKRRNDIMHTCNILLSK